MKSLPARTNFFAVVAATLLLSTAAFAQTTEPPKTVPTPSPTPKDIPYGLPRGAHGVLPTVPVEWREFKSEAGGFTVKFPAAPHVEQVPFTVGPVSLTRHTHVALVEGGMMFEVDYMDMPAGYSDPALAFEGGIGALVGSMTKRGATVLSKGAVASGTCEGREATLLLPNATGRGRGFTQARIFGSGQRYYMLFFNADEDTPRVRALGRDFMESFSVADGCTAPLAPVAAPSSKVEVGIVEGTRDTQTGWRRIEERDLGFDVLMPDVAHHESAQAQVEPFPLRHDTFISDSGGVVFSAEVVGEYPPKFNDSAMTREGLMGATQYALKRNFEARGFTLAPLRNLLIGTYPGRELSITNEKTGAHGRAQIYVTPKHTYIFIALAREDTPEVAKGVERFFSSVRISPR
jgi:hypothetical protein